MTRRLALAALGLAWCGASLAAGDPSAVTLRVMTFNVWYGGEQVSLAKVAEAIRAADPDIVGLQEADRNLERVAELAGMPYVDPRRRLLSRWPIFDSGSGERTESGASPYSTTALDMGSLHAWVMVRPGKVVAVSNVHLSNGAALGDLRRGETAPLTSLGRLAGDGTPVFLTGDFNTPSHLDRAGAGLAVTRMLADAGLRDSYREAHPDPVAEFRALFPRLPNPCFPLKTGDKAYYHALCALAGGFTAVLWRDFFTAMATRFGAPREALAAYPRRIIENVIASSDGAPISSPAVCPGPGMSAPTYTSDATRSGCRYAVSVIVTPPSE